MTNFQKCDQHWPTLVPADSWQANTPSSEKALLLHQKLYCQHSRQCCAAQPPTPPDLSLHTRNARPLLCNSSIQQEQQPKSTHSHRQHHPSSSTRLMGTVPHQLQHNPHTDSTTSAHRANNLAIAECANPNGSLAGTPPHSSHLAHSPHH